MNDVPHATLDAFVETCHTLAARNLVRCSSGNLSLRVSEDRMLIKSSRAWMERLTRSDISVCRLSDGALLEGPKPSVELGIHRGVLAARPEVNAVLHFQSPYATAVACSQVDLERLQVIPEIPFYIGTIGRVAYFMPGSAELAGATTDAMRRHNLVLLDHHGQVTAAADLDHVVQNAVFFEFACQILTSGGLHIETLTADAIMGLRGMAKYAAP